MNNTKIIISTTLTNDCSLKVNDLKIYKSLLYLQNAIHIKADHKFCCRRISEFRFMK